MNTDKSTNFQTHLELASLNTMDYLVTSTRIISVRYVRKCLL